jgi:hypothetical protein
VDRRLRKSIGIILGIFIGAASQVGVQAAGPGHQMTRSLPSATGVTETGIQTPEASTAESDISDSGSVVPRLVEFSGEIKHSTSQTNRGLLSVRFAIYDQEYGGTALWVETQNVQLDRDGKYTVLLGADTTGGLPMDLFKSGKARWLGVEPIDPDAEIPARVLLVSVPYALKAGDAETLGGLPASAFVQANVQGSSASGTTSTTSPTAGKTVPPAKTAKGSQATAAASTSTANQLAKFDATGNLVPSAVSEVNGMVGIGTSAPSAPLQVDGNILLSGQATQQVQVVGAASSGRFGQDGLGTFLASDSKGSTLRFLTNNGTLNEWMRIDSGGTLSLDSGLAGRYGTAVFARDDLDSVHSVIGQAGSQYHFRLSRATPDIYGFKDFLIAPYNYGMSIEYPGTIEVWSGNFSVHMNPSCPVSSLCGPGANFWVGDEIDSGGLWVTALDDGGGANSKVILAADRFTHASHGSMDFVVRDPTDAFRFDFGPYGSEVMNAQISANSMASSLDLYSGTAQLTLRASSGSTGGVQIGATSNSALRLFTGNGAAQVTLFPSGNFSIGNALDTAPLAVGSQGQFQVSSAGGVTIGGGTPIVEHLSALVTLAFPNFSGNSCNTLTMAVHGASDGDTVVLGVPNALGSLDGVTWFGWVSAPGVVSVRGCNATMNILPAPAAANVRIDVWRH